MKSSKTFLYQKVFADIKSKIASGEYGAGHLLPSEREIGELYQVDRTTVRKALLLLCEEHLVTKLPGKGTCVSHAPSAPQIPQPQIHASSLPIKNIAFILPRTKDASDRITFPTYAGLLFVAEKECSRNHFRLVYMTLDDEDSLEKYLASMEYAGIIFLSAVAEKHIEKARQLHIPSVLLNNCSELITSIMPDNFNGGYQAAKYLLDMGHRNLLLLSGNRTSTNCRERIKGFTYACFEYGVPFDQTHILGGDQWSFDYGYQEIITNYPSFRQRPTAIFACGDRLALGASKALKELGLNIPEDVSVIGYDNSEQAQYATPKLTSVDTNLKALGTTAVYALMDHIRHPALQDTPLKIIVPAVLSKQESVGAAK